MWRVYGEESGEEMFFKTKREAQEWIRGVKAFDKRNGIGQDEVWILEKVSNC